MRAVCDTRIRVFRARWNTLLHYRNSAPRKKLVRRPCRAGLPAAVIRRTLYCGVAEAAPVFVAGPARSLRSRLRQCSPAVCRADGATLYQLDGGSTLCNGRLRATPICVLVSKSRCISLRV